LGQVQGKVAIVTGGASGIGAACAATLAREGAQVVVTDIDHDGGKEVVAHVRGNGGEAIFLPQDVTEELRWREVIGETESRYGRLDILVSNAGIAIVTPSIVDMTLAGYCATKGGVRLFAKAIAMECAAAGNGIRVNSVHPGIIDTPIWNKMMPAPTSDRRNAPIDPHEAARLAVPLGRAGVAQDVADGVLFLASDASSYITGTEIVIDGGMMGGVVRRSHNDR